MAAAGAEPRPAPRLFTDPVSPLEPFTGEEIGIGLWSVLDSAGLARDGQVGRIEMACYMFWDVDVIWGAPDAREGNVLEDAVLDVLDDAPRIPHAACQESATTVSVTG